MFVTFYKMGRYIWANAMINGISCTLADLDHQSLIDTIEKIWPDWRDTDQYLIKRGYL